MLKIKNLTVQFGSLKAIDNLTFELSAGQIAGIVGESGSGKSMTALSIMGLLPPEAQKSGKIFFGSEEERELTALSEREMQKIRGNHIAMIFQDPLSAFNSSQTIGKQLIEILKIHQKIGNEQARQRIFELFEKVRLAPAERIFNAYPFQLSGGQRQRALIAMALANKPQLLIADEPTTALDVTVQKEIVDLLRVLVREESLAMVFISHDLALVSQIADHILVMYKGKLAEQGKAADVISNPQNSYTKALLQCKPTLQHQKRRLPEVSDLFENDLFDASKQDPVVSRITEKNMIEVRNLDVEYIDRQRKQKVRAVDNVTFHLLEGETLGLVGESGCGKTTLSRTLLNLIHFTAGNIVFQGKPMVEFARNRLAFSKEIQIVFQDPYSSLNPTISIGEAVNEALRIHWPEFTRKQSRMKTIGWLERVGLAESYYKRLPGELSGGQRQRVVIARSLVPQPKILICDEAVSALDVSVQARVLNLLNDLKAGFGLTYIFISHDLAVVKYMADRMVIMQNGKFVEVGNPDQIYYTPQNPYTQKLIDSVPNFNK
jgi:peptide/nickel transport system ATP-binding protein